MKLTYPILAGLSLLSSLAVAQNERTPPAPAQIAQHEVARYTTLLSLTAAQQDQATAIFTDEATTEQSLRANERTAHQALEAAVTGEDTAAIQQQATALGTLQGQSIAARATGEARLYAILTADQKTKFTDLKSQHLLEGRGPGGPGGPLR